MEIAFIVMEINRQTRKTNCQEHLNTNGKKKSTVYCFMKELRIVECK